MKIYTSVDLRNNEVDNIKIQTTAPDPPVEGNIYYDVGTNRIKYYDGIEWVPVGGDSGGGSGQDNVLEYVNVKVGTNTAQNLRTDSNKIVKLSFSTTGNGDLTIKDVVRNYILGTLNIGNGSENGLAPTDFIAAGTLTSGHKNFTVQHSLGTDAVLVQVVDNSGNTVECNVQRRTVGTDHFVYISFAQNISQNYKFVIVGSPNYSTVTVTPIT